VSPRTRTASGRELCEEIVQLLEAACDQLPESLIRLHQVEVDVGLIPDVASI
jgi:hypothetical protein